jgi:hypothetical protein
MCATWSDAYSADAPIAVRRNIMDLADRYVTDLLASVMLFDRLDGARFKLIKRQQCFAIEYESTSPRCKRFLTKPAV